MHRADPAPPPSWWRTSRSPGSIRNPGISRQRSRPGGGGLGPLLAVKTLPQVCAAAREAIWRRPRISSNRAGWWWHAS